MAIHELKLEDWDTHDQFAKDIADEPLETDKAEYRYASTTDFQGTKVFQILNDYL